MTCIMATKCRRILAYLGIGNWELGIGNWESHELWQNYMKAPRAYMVAKVDAVKPVGPDVALSSLARELSIRTHR